MTIHELIQQTPVSGGTYLVADDGHVTSIDRGGLTVANAHQLDSDALLYLASNHPIAELQNRTLRTTLHGSSYRIVVLPQVAGLQIERIDPSEISSIAAGYGAGTDSSAAFAAFLADFVNPRVSRPLTAYDRRQLATALAWEQSNNDPPLTAFEFLDRLAQLHSALADELRDSL